jgi:thioredoxin-related protein
MRNWLFMLFFIPMLAVADEAFFDQSLGDLQEELVQAREDGKQGVLLFFEMEECPFCTRMKQTVFSQPEVQAYFKQHFLILPIDVEGGVELTNFDGARMTSKEFANKIHRVRATPVMIFFDLEGKSVYRHTGPTQDAQEFLWLGEYVLSGKQQEMKFSQFRQAKRGE